MPLTPSSPAATGWSRLTGVILPITIVGAILVLIIPVPPLVLDLLLSANVTLAVASGEALRSLAVVLAAATLVLGLIDYGVQYQRFEARLRLTPDEEREDRRATEGDPALRARRRQVAKNWRGDSRELLAGASLVLTGPSGLTLVLAGGPPPRRVSIRMTAQGASGARLRTSAEAAKLPQVAAPGLARQLARRRPPGLSLSAEILGELAALWPSPRSPESAEIRNGVS